MAQITRRFSLTNNIASRTQVVKGTRGRCHHKQQYQKEQHCPKICRTSGCPDRIPGEQHCVLEPFLKYSTIILYFPLCQWGSSQLNRHSPFPPQRCIQILPLPHVWHKKNTECCKSILWFFDISHVTEWFVCFQHFQVQNEFSKVLQLESWPIRIPALTDPLLQETTKDEAQIHSKWQLAGRISKIETQSWDEGLVCTSRHQNEPCVITGHTISTQTDRATAQAGEEKHKKITAALKNLLWRGAQTHRGKSCGTGTNILQYTRKAICSDTLPQ